MQRLRNIYWNVLKLSIPIYLLYTNNYYNIMSSVYEHLRDGCIRIDLQLSHDVVPGSYITRCTKKSILHDCSYFILFINRVEKKGC